MAECGLRSRPCRLRAGIERAKEPLMGSLHTLIRRSFLDFTGETGFFCCDDYIILHMESKSTILECIHSESDMQATEKPRGTG